MADLSASEALRTIAEKSQPQNVQADLSYFLRGAEYGIFQKPADGMTQLFSGGQQNTASMQIVDAPAEGDKFGQAGSAVGSAIDFCLIDMAVGRLSGIGQLAATSTARMEALKMGLTGALVAAATPVQESDHFGLRKTAAFVDNVGEFAIFGAINGKATSLGLMGRPGFRSYLSDSIVYGLSGTASGLVGAELHTGLTKGRLATFKELGVGAGENMALGFALAGFDHIVPGNKLKIDTAPDGAKTSKLTTEDWVAQHYDGQTEIRSPILTFLAESRPELRPPDYEVLRLKAFAENNTVDLSLGDWAPEQRTTVITELRRMGNSKLWTDQNIDAFISRFTTPDLVARVSDYEGAVRPVNEAIAKAQDALAKHPELAGKRLEALRYDPKAREEIKNAGNGDLLDLIDEVGNLQYKTFASPEEKSMNESLQSTLDKVSSEIGLPRAKIVGNTGQSGQSFESYIEVGLGHTPALSAESLERTIHEFNHHLQGPIYGKETLTYLAKYPIYKGLSRLGWIDEIPPMQQANSTAEYFSNYIGTTKEIESYSIGLLSRLRALAAGRPSEANV